MPNRDMLAIARNLARIYRDVLEEPLPPALEHLLARLENGAAGPSAADMG